MKSNGYALRYASLDMRKERTVVKGAVLQVCPVCPSTIASCVNNMRTAIAFDLCAA